MSSMAQRFNQHRIREIAAVLRQHARDGKRIRSETAFEAATLIEELTVVVYGIQEKFPEREDVETGEAL